MNPILKPEYCRSAGASGGGIFTKMKGATS